MSMLADLPGHSFTRQTCFRLINSKYPPISIFDDVADQDEFDAIFEVQKLTNPRLLNEIGQLNLVPPEKRPFGITGCNYALGPFVHVNQAGSRFSRGEFGVFYAAGQIETAISETRYHQQAYFKKVQGLKFDRIVMRALRSVFSAELVNIFQPLQTAQGWYDPNSYDASQGLGDEVKKNELAGLWYGSVRDSYQPCFALFSPEFISEVIQTEHYEYIWDGQKISHTLKVK